MTMHFRKQSIADSVMERISAIADSVKTGASLPAPRGASTIALERQPDGGLLVTKTFENGETELMTISNTSAAENQPVPEGFIDVTPAEQPGEQTTGAVDPSGIVESAALGGDSLDALLKA